MQWNAIHNGKNLPTKDGQYLITIKIIDGDEVSRFTTTADFHRRINLFSIDDANDYSWTWSDGCGENMWSYCINKWDYDGTVYVEEITAWAEMPEPYVEE